MICLTPNPTQSFFVYCIQNKKKNFFFYRKRAFFKETGEIEDWTKNEKKPF